MNPLAATYALRLKQSGERRAMAKLAKEIREANAKFRPIFEKNEKLRKERMRQEGPNGFKMVFDK